MDLRALPDRYRLILCDLWGCVHDGRAIFPGVRETLAAWKRQGRTVLFVTNAPRTADAIRTQLVHLGLDPALDDGIVSAGEAGLAAVRGRPVGFCGTEADRLDLTARGLSIASSDYDELACAGLADDETIADYTEALEAWRDADVLMHCLNPDRVAPHFGKMVICAGALADAYETLGGRVIWYGKPYPAVYDYALQMAGETDKAAVIAIGDGLQTDMAGAAAFGIDAIFVANGVHAGEDPRFADGWRPIAIVEGLGTPAAARA